MKPDSDAQERSRVETDASLGTERAVADDAVAQAVARAERQLDTLIARARVLADHGMEPQRRRTDHRGETQRTDEAPMAHEARRSTDQNLTAERNEADAVAADLDASESALEDARRAEDDRAQVFAMVTHDLRNPLCVILASADLIADRAEDSRIREAAGDIRSAAARMGRLLTDLMELARIDAGTFRLDERSHSVRALLSEMRRSYQPLFDDRGVTLSVDVPPADVDAFFDRDRIVELLSNLLGNAMKFTPQGGNVSLDVEHDADELVFVVRDDGAGIPPSALPHLFERFWQRDLETRRGLGLGLYLCRTIARAHGGDISVQSEVGAGSTFRVRLPMRGSAP